MKEVALPLTSLKNIRVKQWAALLEKKHRDRSGLFIIEGTHLVLEALASGAEVQSIVYDAERGLPGELRPYAANGTGAEWVAASTAILAKCTGTDTAPPVFAVVAKPKVPLEPLLSSSSLVVLLDGVRDPGNAGTLIRSADAVGADAVVLGRGSVDLYNPKTLRSTMGSLFHLPVIEADLQQLLPQVRQQGIRIAAAGLQAAVSCYELDWSVPTWLVLGNESNGVSPAVTALADSTIKIPMRGRAESLNVAMAGTVLLFEAQRQRMLLNK